MDSVYHILLPPLVNLGLRNTCEGGVLKFVTRRPLLVWAVLHRRQQCREIPTFLFCAPVKDVKSTEHRVREKMEF